MTPPDRQSPDRQSEVGRAQAASASPSTPAREILGKSDVERILKRLAHEILESKGAERLALVGIRTGGDYLAHQLADLIRQIEGTEVPVGLLDITLYRDDLAEQALQPQVKETDIPFDMTGQDVLLVDDVLYTGRTIRAALNALMDFGRPARVMLGVLIDRGHRELPIRPDYVGKNIPTEAGDRVEVVFSDDHKAQSAVLFRRDAS